MNEFKTSKEQQAYKLGRLDGMIYYQKHIINNMKNEHDKLIKKRAEIDNNKE